MARKRIDLGAKIAEMLEHVQPLPPEAGVPLAHYHRASTDFWNLYEYIDLNLARIPRLQPAAVRRHLGRLLGMLLVHHIEAFERYLKELAAACVDCLRPFILDDRFNVFRVQGSVVATHFGAGNLGQALCESSTWLDTDEINERFRKLLADPFQKDSTFHLFPRATQQPASDRGRYEILALVWQLRHTVVHNVGVITPSDAVRFRLMAKRVIPAPRLLVPTRDDIRYLRRFLDETAEACNERVGNRLAELLTTLHTADPALFDAREMADRVSQVFGMALTVAGMVGALPPP